MLLKPLGLVLGLLLGSLQRRAKNIMIGGRSARRAAASAALALASMVGNAAAEPPPPPPESAPTPGAEASDLTPPSLAAPAEVPYPEGAHGDAIVVLMLTVGRDGAVAEVRAIEGDEPFASSATAAAGAWKFEPAQRRGQAVAARIRFEVQFHEPPRDATSEAPETNAPSGSSTAPPGNAANTGPDAAARAAPRPTEITIVGERSPPGVSTFTRAEVRQLPGAFGDPFRAIEALPGVTPIVSGVPFFYLRGAPPGNIGYFLDGVRVPYLYHVGLGPSVIHPGMVERVDLYPGGYPAQFGRFAGGIVAAEATAPRADLHGEGNIRLFDLGAMAETGFAGGKGTALVAGRYSYTAAMLSLLAPEVALDYRDFEARVSYDLSPDDRVTMFTFGSYDLIGDKKSGNLEVLFGSEFYRLDTRYDRRLGPSSKLRAAVTLGYDRTKIPDEPRTARNEQVQARVEVTHSVSSHAELRGGADALVEAYRTDLRPYSDPDDPGTREFNALFTARDDVTLGAWTDAVLKYPGVTVTPGIRADLYRSGKASAVGIDPRIAARIEVTDRIRFLHTFGVAHQPPSFIIPVPGLAIGSLQGGLQTSLQSSAGVEIDLPDQTTATFSVFDNVFLNMSDTIGVTETQGEDDGLLSSKRSLGSAVGAEVYIRRKLTRRLGGFLSYTLSRSMRSVGQERFPSAFDRTHVLNAALSFDLGRNWRAGTRFVLYTGIPSQIGKSIGPPPPRGASPPRDPAFYRLDLRLEKRWVYSQRTYLSFIAEMMNATLHKEVLFGESIGPVSIPSVGVEVGF
ncbi:MAG TPA: energy transducer TonB [Polyangiaceae bacterium]|nr:energy transducer TonB [Polyangiaceae bacterium]